MKDHEHNGRWYLHASCASCAFTTGDEFPKPSVLGIVQSACRHTNQLGHTVMFNGFTECAECTEELLEKAETGA